MPGARLADRLIPLLDTLKEYRREFLIGDLNAGVIVAVTLIPQAMAYAMLAGLPPQVGLYASIMPLVAYALFGTSRTLAVGPVAIISLLVVSGVGKLAEPGSIQFLSLSLTLTLMVGVIQLILAALRMGFLVNFISHPVLIGFASAAAIVIGFSQLEHLLGVSVEEAEYPFQLIAGTLTKVDESNMATLAIGLSSMLALIGFLKVANPLLKWLGVPPFWALVFSKVGPLVVLVASSVVIYVGQWNESYRVAIIGEIPAGLPGWSRPDISLESVRSLFPLALVITAVGYLESIAVAKTLANRRRERVDVDRELLGLGMADVAAAFTSGYPVTGGLSRSLVNHSAGAKTSIASIITAILVALSVTLFTPMLFYIPRAALAAIIIVAVSDLVDFSTPRRYWKFSRPDASALIVTFLAVLGLGIETGVMVGFASTLVMLTWRISKPHVAEVGRIAGTEHFRNVRRYEVEPCEGVLAIRVDESLNFINAPFLVSYLNERISKPSKVRAVLLIGSGINDIDATGIETLESIRNDLATAGIHFYLSDVKGPVMDRLRNSGFDPEFLVTHVFLSAHLAMEFLESGQNLVTIPEAGGSDFK